MPWSSQEDSYLLSSRLSLAEWTTQQLLRDFYVFVPGFPVLILSEFILRSLHRVYPVLFSPLVLAAVLLLVSARESNPPCISTTSCQCLAGVSELSLSLSCHLMNLHAEHIRVGLCSVKALTALFSDHK